MASLEAFVLCFCALDHVNYASWFPINIRHENTLNGIQRICQHCWYGRCLSHTINVCTGNSIICKSTIYERYHTIHVKPYLLLIFEYSCGGGIKEMFPPLVSRSVHRALCSLFQPDTDDTRVSKCRQLSQETRGLDPMLFQCWPSDVGGGPILKQHWVKSSCLLGSTQVSVYTHPPPPPP